MANALAASQHGDVVANPVPYVSVVVPAFNSQTTIVRCLAALERQTLARERYEILVIDDGSSDDTRARVTAFSKVQLLSQNHAGPAAARNLGAQHARGEIVLFTDADCEPAPDWIEQMLAPFADAQTVGVKGIYRTRQRALVARFVQMEYETRYERMARHMARDGCIDFVDTYAAGYRRDLLMSNGGFETTFATASVEDQELSFRIAEQGHRLVFAPQAIVYHWGHAATLPAYARKKCKIGYYKVNVLARHSGKVWKDAHTPQRLKAQILIVGLGVCALWVGLFSPIWLWTAAGLGVLFWATTLRFSVTAWKQDPSVAIAAPFLLLLRALALGSGMGMGILSYLLGQSARLVTR